MCAIFIVKLKEARTDARNKLIKSYEKLLKIVKRAEMCESESCKKERGQNVSRPNRREDDSINLSSSALWSGSLGWFDCPLRQLRPLRQLLSYLSHYKLILEIVSINFCSQVSLLDVPFYFFNMLSSRLFVFLFFVFISIKNKDKRPAMCPHSQESKKNENKKAKC